MVAISPAFVRQPLYGANGELFKSYAKVRLVDSQGKSIRYHQLKKEVAYVFAYPFASTPNFLLRTDRKTLQEVRLKAEDGSEYIWRGGIGKDGDLVAYSAICPHQLTHPTPRDSFISYVPQGQKTMACQRGGVIVCSSHLSAYDPKAGAKVVAGPAPQPLASVILEMDKKGEIFASAILGGEKFHDYFRSFKPELKELFGNIRRAKRQVEIKTELIPLDQYSKEIIQY